MKRILVTGASGFIGVHCLRPLIARGYEVHAVSRTARADGGDGVHWHATDLLRPGAAREIVDSVRPSHLLHLSWIVTPGKSIASPENFEWVSASLELVRRFAETGGARLVVCGSSYEYDWRFGYCTEELTPCVPDTIYGACKMGLHELVRSVAMANKLSFGWPRVFFLYGPHEHPQRLVASVIRALLRGQAAPCSHGRQIRDYMHVQDVADGIVTVLESEVQGAINVSSGEATTIRDIVLATGRILGCPELVQLGALPARANDAPLVVGANARLAALGWRRQLDQEAGLRETIGWWRTHMKAEGET